MSRSSEEHVVVFFGGTSAEAEVSVVSGTAIAEALLDRNVHVLQVLVARDGEAALLPLLHRRGGRSPQMYTASTAGTELTCTFEPLDALLERIAHEHVDLVAIPALHGPGDEDGEVQVALDRHGIPFVGAAHAAARLGMEKHQFKALAHALGLPTLPYLLVTRQEWAADQAAARVRVAAFAAEHTDGGALIGKPTAHGSSIGMRIARGESEWPEAIELALRFGDVALLEPYLERPRELEVALLEYPDGRVDALGPGEVFSGREFYDYDAKYLPGVSRTTTSADIPHALRAELHAAATQLFAASGCRDLARIDFLLARTGSRADAWFISEINTFPGFTPISLYPALAEAAGIGFADLCLQLVATARARGGAAQ
jgi:D-alanine-D-alanine ligase